MPTLDYEPKQRRRTSGPGSGEATVVIIVVAFVTVWLTGLIAFAVVNERMDNRTALASCGVVLVGLLAWVIVCRDSRS